MGDKNNRPLSRYNLVAPGTANTQGAVQAGVQKEVDGAGDGTVGDYPLQTVPEPDADY